MEILTRSSGYIFLVFVFTFLVQRALAICTELCTDDKKGKTRTLCQLPATRLEKAELKKDGTLVCNGLYELLECVGKEVPQCLGVISEQYQDYTYTPWDCHPSDEQTMKYQKLVKNGCTSKSEPQSDSYSNAVNIYTSSKQMVVGVFILYILSS